MIKEMLQFSYNFTSEKRKKIFKENLVSKVQSNFKKIIPNKSKKSNEDEFIFYEKNEIEKDGMLTIFGQYFTKYGKNLALQKINDSLINTIAFELQSNYLELFVKTPNNKNRIGLYRDRYIPNPLAKKELYKNMFNCLGVFIFECIRDEKELNLNLHPIFYKKLLRKEISFDEIESLDLLTYKYIKSLEAIKDENEFNEKYPNIYFTAHSSADNTVIIELVKNGKYKKVTFEKLQEYIKLYKKFLIEEMDEQVFNININFLSHIYDITLLGITPEELEELLCGIPSLKLDLLRERTLYENYEFDSPTIINFWKALESFTEEEKNKYLKFVSGRSRLPDPRNVNFYHIISMITEEDIDQKIPTSSITHFTLYLPNYSSYEVLIEKLRYAINNYSINPENPGEIYYDE